MSFSHDNSRSMSLLEQQCQLPFTLSQYRPSYSLQSCRIEKIEIHPREGVRFSIPTDLELPTFLGGQIAGKLSDEKRLVS
jgi:hypothetical protein